MSDERFTKIAAEYMGLTRELIDWGIEGGHTSPDDMRFAVCARKPMVIALEAKGIAIKQIAGMVGCSINTVKRDLGIIDRPNGQENRPNGHEAEQMEQKNETDEVEQNEEEHSEPQEESEMNEFPREEQWNNSLASIASDITSLPGSWDQMFGKQWKIYVPSPKVMAMARKAASILNELVDSLERKHKL